MDRVALVVYVPLALLALGLFLIRPEAPTMWVSRAAAALYLPFRLVSTTTQQLSSLLVERGQLATDSQELRRARRLLQELREENLLLREQAGFARRDTLHLLPAWVLAKLGDRLGTRVLINRGNQDGVRMGSAVLNRGGLVGRVDALEAHLARVRLLTHRASAVSARVERSRVEGVVEGDPLEGLRLRFVPSSADVRVGDEVVTSGLGGGFPEGLRVGRVRALGLEQGGLLRRIDIEPAAPPEHLEDVFVLVAPDSSRGWGYLWAQPKPPADSLAGSVRADGPTP
ncbi:MAG: rod shape-determining protein MreC [Candidatus Eisenbacteria bacterium]|nr:rod shape-determining protein MreC [Candidatus Eisenbacteria bacterium]